MQRSNHSCSQHIKHLTKYYYCVSGLVGLLKVILASRHGILPKNLHFNEPNPNIPSLKDGRLKAVTTNTPWQGGTVGISAFGFGGAIAHVIVKAHTPRMINSGPSRPDKSSVPLMLFCSGNTEETVEALLGASNDAESLRMFLEKQSCDSLHYQPARGFSLSESDIRETCLNEVLI